MFSDGPPISPRLPLPNQRPLSRVLRVVPKPAIYDGDDEGSGVGFGLTTALVTTVVIVVDVAMVVLVVVGVMVTITELAGDTFRTTSSVACFGCVIP
jgi:hypothetical protein